MNGCCYSMAAFNSFKGDGMNKVFAMIAITITFMVFTGFSEPKQGMTPEVKQDSMGKIDRNTQYNETVKPDNNEWHHRGMLEQRHGWMPGGSMYYPCEDMGCLRHPMKRPFIFIGFFMMLCLVLMAIVNILLTIIVTLDMTRTKRFNGLWIPITLIVGLPGTALYALFRIGDNLKSGEQKQ
jgi:hypothetical protein